MVAVVIVSRARCRLAAGCPVTAFTPLHLERVADPQRQSGVTQVCQSDKGERPLGLRAHAADLDRYDRAPLFEINLEQRLS